EWTIGELTNFNSVVLQYQKVACWPRSGRTAHHVINHLGGYEALLSTLIMMLLSALHPLWSDQWVSADEGGNFMKTALVTKGFHLYSEIWNDQPPVLTYVLVPTEMAFPGNMPESV